MRPRFWQRVSMGAAPALCLLGALLIGVAWPTASGAAECAGPTAAVSALPSETRLSFLRASLHDTARLERRFALGWSLTYAGLAAGTWFLLPFADDFEGQRRASAWNSATSVAAGLLILIDPLLVIRDHRRLEALLAADPSASCATLAAAEKLLGHAAGSEQSARGPRAHILGALTTVGLGLVLGYALQRPESAAINTTIGVFLSEIMIASRPTVAMTRLQRYRSGDLSVSTAAPPAGGLSLGVVPLRLDSGYGAALSGAF
jgi:hypothetical protein